MSGVDLSVSRIVITGGRGFLGWHVACQLRAVYGNNPERLGRAEFAEPAILTDAIARADVVIHLAGVNRAETDSEVEQGNQDLATAVAAAVAVRGRPLAVVYGNSTQALIDNAYGRGKKRAGEILAKAVGDVGGVFANVMLPNLFGEHGRPHYNSFVATFCHLLATGRNPEVQVDREVSLLHAQDAAEVLLTAALAPRTCTVEPVGQRRRVSDVLTQLRGFHSIYALGEIPAFEDDFAVDLFNTYRSYTFPGQFPMHPKQHADDRGALVEAVRVHGGTGMAFVSTTRPGRRRGDHYHLSKIERFFVVAGEAEIALRRLFHDEIVTFRLSGDNPGFVDMPTMWVHNIRNVGHTDLVTVFWADQLLDLDNPDQYPERVELENIPL